VVCLQEQDLAKPATQQSAAEAGSKGNNLSPGKENRPDGAGTAAEAAGAGTDGSPAQDASPFAAISASMGWDTFYLVCYCITCS
jgi:hypothetical protein